MIKLKEIYPIVKDLYYPVDESVNDFYIRQAVRAFLFRDNKFCLIHITGKDKFGKRDHYETPGGGVENGEDFKESLKREISEETGYTIKNIKEIGKIAIEYHLFNRIDVENFFYADVDEAHESHLLDYEKALFSNYEWFTVDEAINMYQTKKETTVGKMIHERDLNALLYLKKFILNAGK